MHIRPWIAGLLFALQTIGGSTQRSGADRIITCTPPAPPSFARGDDMVRGAIPLTPENIILAGNGRLFTPCESTSEYGALPRYVAEASLLGSGLRSTDPRLRRLTAIAWGQIGALINSPLLADPDPSVRIASADGFANELLGITSDLTSLATLPINGRARAVTPLQISNGRATLETAARRERVDQVAAVILESLGRLRLEEADAARTEQFLVEQSKLASPERVLGAVKGLEAFVRANPTHPLNEETQRQLRDLSARGRMGTSRRLFTDRAPTPDGVETLARTRRLAMLILQATRDPDIAPVLYAAADPDWQVRRIAVQRMDATMTEFTEPLKAAVRDESFQVRLEAARIIARPMGRTRMCAPLMELANDPAPQVAMQALDLLPVVCEVPDNLADSLAGMAEQLRSGDLTMWHVPARALAALARMKAPQTNALNEIAIEHPAWQVRATAAGIAADLRDESGVLRLARDREANVQTAALGALARLKSPALFETVIKALESDDEQLVRTAAGLLKGAADRGPAVDALLIALARLTRTGRDTSRDARAAIVQRIEELAPPDRIAPLLPYCDDVDPKIAALARLAFPPPPSSNEPPPRPPAWRHYPDQPNPADLLALPRTAIIHMSGGLGVIQLELLGDAAPATVARFTKLVRTHYYDGLTFHRVVPNFVIQGGSPGANEYVGDKYYMRDEIGPTPHLRGSVGLSTRGHDTGDAQFFIDLVDLPRLDHEYTVFARVVSGLEIVDRILEGAKIETVTVR